MEYVLNVHMYIYIRCNILYLGTTLQMLIKQSYNEFPEHPSSKKKPFPSEGCFLFTLPFFAYRYNLGEIFGIDPMSSHFLTLIQWTPKIMNCGYWHRFQETLSHYYLHNVVNSFVLCNL